MESPILCKAFNSPKCHHFQVSLRNSSSNPRRRFCQWEVNSRMLVQIVASDLSNLPLLSKKREYSKMVLLILITLADNNSRTRIPDMVVKPSSKTNMEIMLVGMGLVTSRAVQTTTIIHLVDSKTQTREVMLSKGSISFDLF